MEIINGITSLNGYGLPYSEEVLKKTKLNKSDYWTMSAVVTVMNIGGYIPLVGIISAIARVALCYLGVKNKKLDLGNIVFCFIQGGRGVAEGFGLGIVFLIPDLAITVARIVAACFGKGI